MLSLKGRYWFIASGRGQDTDSGYLKVIFQVSPCVKVRNLLAAHTFHILLDETMAVARSEKWRSNVTQQVPHKADSEMETTQEVCRSVFLDQNMW